MKRVANAHTSWYLVNVKARREQTTDHYIRVFNALGVEDPLISFPRGGKSGSLKYIKISNDLDNLGYYKWMELGLLSYTIINPEAFYNRRRREYVIIDNWNEDVVANKKEAIIYFIPSAHILAVRCNSKISLKNIVFYLSVALNRIEPEGFDVDTIKQRDVLERILTAHAITHLHANISYSNPGHSDGFYEAFDSKLRDMGASRVEIIASGSKDHPLNGEDDGMLQSIVNLSEHNGYVQATIQSTENGKLEKIDSNEHPRKMIISEIVNDINTTIYNTIRQLFN